MLAALAFVLVNILIVRGQPAAHTAVLLVGALAWLVGSVAVRRPGTQAALFAGGYGWLAEGVRQHL